MGAARRLERHTRRTRLLHTATYLVTIPLLVTGWWITLGGEGHPSPIAWLFGTGDVRVHRWLGWALAVLVIAPIVFGWRGVRAFARETFRRDPGDGRWWARWPSGALTGRFSRHQGEFDPGQRLANLAIVAGLVVLTASGIALSTVHGGPTFVWLNRLHRWTAYVVTVVLVGHVVVALGVLPGYRGVWRAMHLDGRVPEETARRVWPAWTERALLEPRSTEDREDSARAGQPRT